MCEFGKRRLDAALQFSITHDQDDVVISRRQTELLSHASVELSHTHITANISMVDSTKVLYPLFDKMETLIPADSPSIVPSVDKM